MYTLIQIPSLIIPTAHCVLRLRVEFDAFVT